MKHDTKRSIEVDETPTKYTKSLNAAVLLHVATENIN